MMDQVVEPHICPVCGSPAKVCYAVQEVSIVEHLNEDGSVREFAIQSWGDRTDNDLYACPNDHKWERSSGGVE